MRPNDLYAGNAVELLQKCEKDTIPLTVTSPPYEDLRNYKGYSFDAKAMLEAIYRVTKPRGVCVWAVGDKINCGRSLVSFDHAFMGRDCGFLIKVPTKRSGWETAVSNKGPDAVNRKRPVELKKEKTKTNIWQYAVGLGGSTSDRIAFQHPAIFPEKLAEDHILSWSNLGDIVLDPMCGHGSGYRHEGNKVSNRIRHFKVNSVGIRKSINAKLAVVWFIGTNETWSVQANEVEPVNVLETGDKFINKICNICHCLLSVDEFALTL